MRSTIAAGGARVRYTMHANPHELADYEFGEGVADFRERRSHVAYTGVRSERYSDGASPQLEQVTDRHMTYLRFGGAQGEWIDVELGAPDEFSCTGDAGGFLELLTAPGPVSRIATDEQFDGKPARRYAITIRDHRCASGWAGRWA